jgi:hypothetical protein
MVPAAVDNGQAPGDATRGVRPYVGPAANDIVEDLLEDFARKT